MRIGLATLIHRTFSSAARPSPQIKLGASGLIDIGAGWFRCEGHEVSALCRASLIWGAEGVAVFLIREHDGEDL